MVLALVLAGVGLEEELDVGSVQDGELVRLLYILRDGGKRDDTN